MEQNIKTNVGLDISMKTYWASITILDFNHEVRVLMSNEFENTPKGFMAMDLWLKGANIGVKQWHFTMEATGVYYEDIAHHLYEQKYAVHVILPIKAKKFAESLDVKSKTDKLDSKSLGRLGVERKLREWQPASPIYKALKELTRERGRLVKVRSQFKNNLHALNHSYQPNKKSIKRIESIIRTLDKNIKEIELELSAQKKKDESLKEKVDQLTSIPGVGEVTAMTVLAETNGFALIENSRQLCSYVGLDVSERQSGKWKGKSKISKKGNSHIRAALYFPALTTIKYSPQHKEFYERIISNKKKSKIGITAVSRKLLILMYSLWKNNTTYQRKEQVNVAA